MARERREVEIDFVCGNCGEDWRVRGRYNSAGEFEAFDGDDLDCPDCGVCGEPTDSDIEVADA